MQERRSMTDMELLRLADKYGVTAVTKFEWNFDKQRFDNVDDMLDGDAAGLLLFAKALLKLGREKNDTRRRRIQPD